MASTVVWVRRSLGVILVLVGSAFTLMMASCDGFLCGAGLVWSVPLAFAGLVLTLWPEGGFRTRGGSGVARRVGHPVGLVVLALAGLAHAVDGDHTFWRGMVMTVAAVAAGGFILTRARPVPFRFTLGVLLAVAGGAAADAFRVCGTEACLAHLAWSVPAALVGVTLATWAVADGSERSVRQVGERAAFVVVTALLAITGFAWILDGGVMFFAGFAALAGAGVIPFVAIARRAGDT